MSLPLLIACIGHIICGITDCMLAYTPDARFDMGKDIKNYERMKRVFEKMPLRQIEISMLPGVLALFMASFGYLELSRLAGESSESAGLIMHISGMFFIVPITAHHVFCGAVEWIFVKLGRTQQALETALTLAGLYAKNAG